MGFAIRLALFVPLHASGYTSDEREYLHLARSVVEGNGFVDTNGAFSQKSPLYPFSLALLFTVTGVNALAAQIVGCVLGALVVWLVFLCGTELFQDRPTAMAAAAVVTFYPGAIIYSGVLQSETLYMVFVLLALYYGYRMVDRPGILTGSLLGLFSGLAALTRAVFFGFFPLLLLWTLFSGSRAGTSRAAPVVMCVLVYGAVLMPWTLRNYSVHNTFVPISTFGGHSLLLGNNPYSTGTWSTKEGFEEWFTRQAFRLGVDDPQSLNEVQRAGLSREIAVDFILDQPIAALQLAAKKAFMYCVYPITNSDTDIGLQAVAIGGDIPLYAAAMVGVVAVWSLRRRLVPVYIALGFFTLVQVVLHAEARYRLPLVPLLAMFTGSGIVTLLKPASRKELLRSPQHKLVLITLLGVLGATYTLVAVMFTAGII